MVAILSGCSGLSDIDIKEVHFRGYTFLNTSSANVEFECVVYNPTPKRIILENLEGIVKKEGINFGRVSLVESDTVAANGISNNRVVLKVEIQNTLSVLSMGLNISSWKASEFKADLLVVVRREKGVKRVIKRKDVPLEDLIERL